MRRPTRPRWNCTPIVAGVLLDVIGHQLSERRRQPIPAPKAARAASTPKNGELHPTHGRWSIPGPSPGLGGGVGEPQSHRRSGGSTRLADIAGNIVARNDVRRTVLDGIQVATYDPGNPTVDTIVRDNHVRGAVVDGFAVGVGGVERPRRTQVVGNEATGSGDDGFDVRSPRTTLARNLAVRSGDLGIDAARGVTDGGGNRARAQGQPGAVRRAHVPLTSPDTRSAHPIRAV